MGKHIRNPDKSAPLMKKYALAEYVESCLKPAAHLVSFTEVHVHHTWEPTIADWRKSGNPAGIIEGMRRYHTETRGFRDIAQHVTVDPDGYIWPGRDLFMSPASAAGYNDSDDDGRHPFMFEMIGNFDIGHEKLEGAQLCTAAGLTKAVLEIWRLPESAVRFHRDMAPKTCPGSGIDNPWFLRQVRDAGKMPKNDPAPMDGFPVIQRIVRGRLNGKQAATGYLIDGKTYVPLRDLAEALGAKVGWDPEKFEYNLEKG